MDMDANPLFDLPPSDASSDSSFTSSIEDIAPAVAPPLPAVLQTINIKSHVPVELDIAESNYTEWRCFFDMFIGKFGLGSHLSTQPTIENRRDLEWSMIDQCILSWLYNYVSKDVRTIVHVPKATAFSIWTAIRDQFQDNEMHRAVYLEAEFRSLVQGDLDITAYTGRLKQVADALHAVGQPVCETSQILNMLRGLSPKFSPSCACDHRQESSPHLPLCVFISAAGGAV
jgi:hypothetical protein